MENRMKRAIKDSVFTMLFSIQAYIMELYRALHPEDNTITPEELTTITLETALVTSIYNDLGLQARDTIIILVEAQSTFSWNLPFRLLLYLAETLDEYVNTHNMSRYSKKPIVIPRPEFYVVYTGTDDVPPVIRLSDLYADKLDDSAENEKRQQEIREKFGWADVEVRVIRKTGNGDILDQYVRFCEIANEMRETYGPTLEAVRKTIDKCLEEGILVEFISSRRTEVETNMKVMFDEEAALRSHDNEVRAEAREEAKKEEREEGIRVLIEALHDVAQAKDAVIQTVAKKFGLQPQIAADKVSLYWQ